MPGKCFVLQDREMAEADGLFTGRSHSLERFQPEQM